jgi:hypothetical protein
MVAVFVEVFNIIVADAVAVCRIIPVHCHLVAIVFIQSVAGAKPHESPAVLENAFHGTIRETLFIAQVFES